MHAAGSRRGSFATAVTCMDGRIQQSVVDWARRQFDVDYVDMVTVPGPDRVLAQDYLGRLRLAADVAVSHRAHGSRQLVVASHGDCAGNPISDDEHEQMVREGTSWLSTQLPTMTIMGVHVDVEGQVVRVVSPGPRETALST